jgi:hypothetical protein
MCRLRMAAHSGVATMGNTKGSRAS